MDNDGDTEEDKRDHKQAGDTCYSQLMELRVNGRDCEDKLLLQGLILLSGSRTIAKPVVFQQMIVFAPESHNEANAPMANILLDE